MDLSLFTIYFEPCSFWLISNLFIWNGISIRQFVFYSQHAKTFTSTILQLPNFLSEKVCRDSKNVSVRALISNSCPLRWTLNYKLRVWLKHVLIRTDYSIVTVTAALYWLKTGCHGIKNGNLWYTYSTTKVFLERAVVELVYKFDEKSTVTVLKGWVDCHIT